MSRLVPLLSVKEVRNRRKRGTTRITDKHQITIPVGAMERSGLQAGDRLAVRADGPGRLIVEREVDVLDELAGSMPGVWQPGDLDKLRDEWER